MDKHDFLAYARRRFGAEPENPFSGDFAGFIFRHGHNRKWFAIGMDVPRSKLGLEGEDTVPFVCLKCGPLLKGSFIDRPGIVPAWHCNKTNWIGVLLDGTAEEETILELLEISYDLTNWIRKKNPEPVPNRRKNEAPYK